MKPVVVVDPPRADPGVAVAPGDVVAADEDGVVCIPRPDAAEVAAGGRRRADREHPARQALPRGELGLDWYDMRPAPEGLGVSCVQADQEGS